MVWNGVVGSVERKVKECFRLFVSNIVFFGRYKIENKIVIVSTGRAGSTLLTLAIARSMATLGTNRLGRILPRLAMWASKDFASRLIDFKKSGAVVLKSHDLFDDSFPDRWKFVFIHGDPLDSVRSVEGVVEKEGVRFFEQHQENLRGVGPYADRYKDDVLNYEGQMLSWTSKDKVNVFVVSYEELWDKIGDISAFVGVDVQLPDQIFRKSIDLDINEDLELFKRLRALRRELTGF